MTYSSNMFKFKWKCEFKLPVQSEPQKLICIYKYCGNIVQVNVLLLILELTALDTFPFT